MKRSKVGAEKDEFEVRGGGGNGACSSGGDDRSPRIDFLRNMVRELEVGGARDLGEGRTRFCVSRGKRAS